MASCPTPPLRRKPAPTDIRSRRENACASLDHGPRRLPADVAGADADVRIALIKNRPKLLRPEREARQRLAKVVDAQLARWHGQKVAERAQKLL